MDTLLTLLAAAGVTYVMGVPGADDVMLNYQSTSFHDALYVREVFGLKRAPEFEAWLQRMKVTGADAQAARGAAVASADRRRGEGRLTCRRRCAIPPAIPGPSWRAGRRRGSRWAARAPRCRRARCWASRWPMPGRAMPCTRRSMRARLRAGWPGWAWRRSRWRAMPPSARSICAGPTTAGGCRRTSRALLQARGGKPCDLALVIGDGLSAAAVHAHAVPLVAALLPHAEIAEAVARRPSSSRAARGWRWATRSARCCGARLVAVLIGERPGLSSPDSLGAYLTYRAEGRPQRCRAQLPLQHSRRGPELRSRRLQARLAGARGAAPLADRRRPQGRERLWRWAMGVGRCGCRNKKGVGSALRLTQPTRFAITVIPCRRRAAGAAADGTEPSHLSACSRYWHLCMRALDATLMAHLWAPWTGSRPAPG